MKTKVLPLPNSDRQIMSPLNIFVIFFEIIRPNPIPLELIYLDASKNPNNLNSFGKSDSFIPTPVSFTDTSIYFLPLDFKNIYSNNGSGCESWSKSLIILVVILTSPLNGVNLIAFEMRFSNTYYNLYLSNLTISLDADLILFID